MPARVWKKLLSEIPTIRPRELPVMRFEMPAPGIVSPNGVPDISPDGQRIAYVATNPGKSAIWIRPIGSLAAQPLRGTENGSAPFWAPDSHRLAFFADGKLKKIDVGRGEVQELCDAVLNAPGSWNKEGPRRRGVGFAANILPRVLEELCAL